MCIDLLTKPPTTQPIVRTSQVSLSSNPDADFRYSMIYTQIGVYKGRISAVKKVRKKSIEITREMKKELKMVTRAYNRCLQSNYRDLLSSNNTETFAFLTDSITYFQMRDLRHDNLVSFIGACTDPPNICIVVEYCARGSLKVGNFYFHWRNIIASVRIVCVLIDIDVRQYPQLGLLSELFGATKCPFLFFLLQDILDNENIKLDNMFMASLVGDIIRVSFLQFCPDIKASSCLRSRGNILSLRKLY